MEQNNMEQNNMEQNNSFEKKDTENNELSVVNYQKLNRNQKRKINRKIKNQRDEINKNTNFNEKGRRKFIEYDYTLTNEEQIRYGHTLAKLNIFCNCCCASIIEDIIKRPFYECSRCYCCDPDNPIDPEDNVCIEIDKNGCTYITFL